MATNLMHKSMVLGGLVLSAYGLLTAHGALNDSSQLQAGEIIVNAPESNSTAASAAEQADRARAYRKEQDPNLPTIILLPGGTQDTLPTPDPMSAPNSATGHRLKAKKYQQGNATDTDWRAILIEPPSNELSASESAKRNRARANSYAKGDLKSVLTGKVGTDGIPLVQCQGINNLAGRIGNDIESGSLFSIIQNNKSVKVRCQ